MALDVERIISIIGYPGIRNDIHDALDEGLHAGILKKVSSSSNKSAEGRNKY